MAIRKKVHNRKNKRMRNITLKILSRWSIPKTWQSKLSRNHRKDKNTIKRFNYCKANWNKYKTELELINTDKILQSEDPNAINEFCINSILQAAEKSIPKSKGFNKSNIKLPKYVLDLIKVRRRLKNIVCW